MGLLDVRVEADPVSCRTAGEWLGGLSGGMRESVDTVRGVNGTSRDCWSGSTGDAFRERMTAAAREADRVAGATERFGVALRVFADDMDTVRSRMDLAREVAGSAGLPVDGDAIGEPGGMGKADATQAAAYQEATTIVAEARQIETRAHTHLASSVATNATDWSTSVLDKLTGAVGAFYGQHLAWTKAAAKYERLAENWEYVFGTDALPAETRLAALSKASVAETKAAQALRYANSNHAFVRFLPDRMKRGLTANVGDNIKDIRYLNRLSIALEKVPYAGVLFTAAGVGLAGLEGQSMTQAAVKGGAEFVAGTAATEGTLIGIEALGVASLAGGPATLIAVAAGIGVAWGVGEIVDHWGGITNGAKEAASGLYNAGQSVERATERGLSAAGNTIGRGIRDLGSIF